MNGSDTGIIGNNYCLKCAGLIKSFYFALNFYVGDKILIMSQG